MTDIVKTIKVTANLHAQHMLSLVKTLNEDIDDILYKNNVELINKIASDYNLNEKELIKKYIKKKKNKIIKEDICNETSDEIVEKNEQKEILIMKKIKIKDNYYILNQETNDIYNMNMKIVGKKENKKYIINDIE
jgi:hypothetical protein